MDLKTTEQVGLNAIGIPLGSHGASVSKQKIIVPHFEVVSGSSYGVYSRND